MPRVLALALPPVPSEARGTLKACQHLTRVVQLSQMGMCCPVLGDMGCSASCTICAHVSLQLRARAEQMGPGTH